ncbi:flagellar filament capping protein FliD [Vulcaniibacterium tengchongense]|uniref:Flagellar hook-associated protein 2 n=1 Tax=Vulcaniibacterium tengchongense TaxID=1273429 RepID=A0A3N4VGP6_9GAMM|nr:flagellar filament capping protein FliD [Vulcaniibacterium tengchongense]RPE80873.1 flagellar hook-associated protein 2 [Vulcaniibacterium tengchongense]
MAVSTLGSGLDIPSLVQQLVAAERAPAENRIARAESRTKTELSALGSLKSAFANLQGALDKLRDGGGSARKTQVPEDAGFTASAGGDAASGRYRIEVLSLASAHKLTSAGRPADAAVGTGTLIIEAGDETIEVAIAEGKNTLADIRSAINAAAAGKGVSASLVNADDGQHLVLTAAATGTANALRIRAEGGDGGLAALAFPGGLGETAAAADAQVKVDGLLRTASGNRITDLLPGVTLALTEAKPGQAFDLTVAVDDSALQTALQGFVSAYNAALSLSRSLTAYNADTQTASTLTGDSMVRGLQSQLRNLASEQVMAFKALGLKIATDGSLSLDGAALGKGLAEDPDALARLFGGDDGYGARLEQALGRALDDDGLFDMRTDNLNARLKSYTEQYAQLDRRMEAVEARYTAQFTAMEQLVTQLQSSSGYLIQQLGATS